MRLLCWSQYKTAVFNVRGGGTEEQHGRQRSAWYIFLWLNQTKKVLCRMCETEGGLQVTALKASL